MTRAKLSLGQSVDLSGEPIEEILGLFISEVEATEGHHLNAIGCRISNIAFPVAIGNTPMFEPQDFEYRGAETLWISAEMAARVFHEAVHLRLVVDGFRILEPLQDVDNRWVLLISPAHCGSSNLLPEDWNELPEPARFSTVQVVAYRFLEGAEVAHGSLSLKGNTNLASID